jgi:hypothetical protein
MRRSVQNTFDGAALGGCATPSLYGLEAWIGTWGNGPLRDPDQKGGFLIRYLKV